LGKNQALGYAQLPAGLDAEFGDQDAPDPLVGLKRVGLASRPVQGAHEERPLRLARWVLAYQALQFGDRRHRVSLEQLSTDPPLQCIEPHQVQPRGLGIQRHPPNSA
jgi:hypothetical protein